MQVSKIILDNIHNIPKVSFGTKPDKESEQRGSRQVTDNDLYSYKPINTDNFKISHSRVFEGMTQKEVKFILDDLYIIATKRGCPNRCLHCYVNAMPAQKDHDNFVSSMPYEDYVKLINGIGLMEHRKQERVPWDVIRTNIYYDSDCMEIGLYDNQGNFHDYTDLHKIYFNATGYYTSFDTGGWNYKQPKMQERAEKYVDYLHKNKDKFYQINLSLSPFSPLYAKAIEYGYNPQKYSATKLDEPPSSNGEKLYREYIERAANMLFTFTPLIGSENFGIIIRPTTNNEKNLKEFSVETYKNTRQNILSRLYQRYKEDLEGEQKYVNSESTIFYYIQEYLNLMSRYDTNLVGGGRYKELFDRRNPNMSEKEKELHFSKKREKEDNYNALKENFCAENLKKYLKFINTDGRVYLYDTYHLIPTELQVKLSTNGKITPALTPKPADNFVITREMINNL